jgi:hypothetical protein
LGHSLIFHTAPSPDVTKDIGDDVYLRDLSDEYKVFAFYYPSAMRDEALEEALRALGGLTGKNLFVNIGKLDDPSFDKIVGAFGIDRYPVVVMTATTELAGADGEHLTAFVRIDEGRLVNDPSRLVVLLQELYGLFLRGEIAAAMSKAKKKQRVEIVRAVGATIARALKSLGGFVADRDVKISLVEGSFELTKSAG